MGKNQPRRRPDIQANNQYTHRDEHRTCDGDNCQNIIAVSLNQRYCSRCRKEQR